jgi:hypothetical protein
MYCGRQFPRKAEKNNNSTLQGRSRASALVWPGLPTVHSIQYVQVYLTTLIRVFTTRTPSEHAGHTADPPLRLQKSTVPPRARPLIAPPPNELTARERLPRCTRRCTGRSVQRCNYIILNNIIIIEYNMRASKKKKMHQKNARTPFGDVYESKSRKN